MLVGALSVAGAALRESQQTRWTAGRSRSAAALSVAGMSAAYATAAYATNERGRKNERCVRGNRSPNKGYIVNFSCGVIRSFNFCKCQITIGCITFFTECVNRGAKVLLC